jgi:glycosyltransferase involved in cell wall biosynthesis
LPYDGTRPLRVALVTSSYNYIKDGIALTLNRLVEYLERQGVEVLVFTPTAAQAAFAHNGTVVAVPSIALPFRPEYRLALGMPGTVQRQLVAFQPDIVHVAVPDLLGHRALTLAKKWGVPVVASYHTRYETYLEYYWYIAGLTDLLTRYLRYFYAACREVYVPSTSMIDALLADGMKNNLRLWTRGIDAQRFSPDKRSTAWRARYGIGADELVILHVARLVREKQLDVLAGILRQVRASGFAHRVVFVGDGPERGALESALPHAIFTGFLDGDDLAIAYASSDIFIFPSDTESFGNVTLEAMASGLPCICANATGSRSLVVPDSTGFLAEPRDVPQFVHYVLQLANDGALRQRMGAAARVRALGFSWDETMAHLLGYYKALLQPAPETAT